MDVRWDFIVVVPILFADGGAVLRGVELRDDAMDPNCLVGDLLGDYFT